MLCKKFLEIVSQDQLHKSFGIKIMVNSDLFRVELYERYFQIRKYFVKNFKRNEQVLHWI